MKFNKPAHGLDFLTLIWVVYAALISWTLPDCRSSLFGGLLICGVLSSFGIWANYRPSGYLFACVNVVGTLLVIMLALGYLVPDRPIGWNYIYLTLLPTYCAWAGIKWTTKHSDRTTEPTG